MIRALTMPCAARRRRREKEDLLASVPGVGPVIARTLIAEPPELGTLGRKQIAALAGLDQGRKPRKRSP